MKKLLVIFFLLICTISFGQTTEYGGTYSYGTTPDSGSTGVIYIYPNSDSTLLFYLELSRGAPSYNSGSIIGQMKISSPGKASFTMIKENNLINCNMSFEFAADSVYIHTINNGYDCGYGHGVFSDGKFERIKRKIPKYFIDRHGDKIWFKNLNWKESWNW